MTATREDIYDQDRGERALYFEERDPKDLFPLPLTKDGFDALLERTTSLYNLPCDDASRAVFAGYIHHLPNEQHTITIDVLRKVLHKSIANSTSWRVDQEIKIKRREAEAKAKADAEAKEPKTNLTVVE